PAPPRPVPVDHLQDRLDPFPVEGSARLHLGREDRLDLLVGDALDALDLLDHGLLEGPLGVVDGAAADDDVGDGGALVHEVVEGLAVVGESRAGLEVRHVEAALLEALAEGRDPLARERAVALVLLGSSVHEEQLLHRIAPEAMAGRTSSTPRASSMVQKDGTSAFCTSARAGGSETPNADSNAHPCASSGIAPRTGVSGVIRFPLRRRASSATSNRDVPRSPSM